MSPNCLLRAVRQNADCRSGRRCDLLALLSAASNPQSRTAIPTLWPHPLPPASRSPPEPQSLSLARSSPSRPLPTPLFLPPASPTHNRTVAPPRPSDPPTTANGSCFHPRHSSTELPRCTSRSPPPLSLSVLFFFRDTFCLFFPLSFSLSENSSGFTVNRCYSFSQVRMARRISSLETSQSVRSRPPRSD